MIGIVRIWTVRFLESDIHDGDIPREACHNATSQDFECDTLGDAMLQIRIRSLDFASSGSDWASDPDGSFVSDYRTGERIERTAHLIDFSDADVTAIIEAVG